MLVLPREFKIHPKTVVLEILEHYNPMHTQVYFFEIKLEQYSTTSMLQHYYVLSYLIFIFIPILYYSTVGNRIVSRQKDSFFFSKLLQ